MAEGGDSCFRVELRKFVLLSTRDRRVSLSDGAWCGAGNGLSIYLDDRSVNTLKVCLTTGTKQKFRGTASGRGLSYFKFRDFEAVWEEVVNANSPLERRKVTVEIFLVRKARGKLTQGAMRVMNRVRVSIGSLELDMSAAARGPQRHNWRILCDPVSNGEVRLDFEMIVTETRRTIFRMSETSFELTPSFRETISDSFTLKSKFCSPSLHSSEEKTMKIGQVSIFGVDSSLADLVKGDLVIMLYSTGGNMVASSFIQISEYLHALRGKKATVKAEMRPLSNSSVVCGSIALRLSILGAPGTSQLSGGVRTETGIFGGRPLFFGVSMPSAREDSSWSFHGSTADATLSSSSDRTWVRVVDSMGIVSFFNNQTQQWSWLPEAHEQFASQWQFAEEPFLHQIGEGMSWVHPLAQRVTESNLVGGGLPAVPGQRDDAQSSSGDGLDSRGIEMISESNTDGESSSRPHSLGWSSREIIRQGDVAERLVLENSVGEKLNPGPARDFEEMEFMWQRLEGEGGYRIMGGPPVEGSTLVPLFDGRKAFKFGGRGRDCRSDEVWAFDADSYVWQEMHINGSRPLARTGHAAARMANGHRMLVFGGSSNHGRLNDSVLLDAVNMKWIPIAPSNGPTPRARMDMDCLENGTQILLFGGREGYRFLGDRYFDELHLFDGERIEWFEVKARGNRVPEPRCSHTAQLINGRQLMVFGGLEDSVRYYDDTWLYDTVSGVWVELPYPNLNKPWAREGHAASKFMENQVVIYGGNGESGAYLNDVHVFDCDSLQWRPRPILTGASPGARCGASMVEVNQSCLLVFGGDVGFQYKADTHLLELTSTSGGCVANSFASKLRWAGAGDSCIVCLDREIDIAFLWCGHCCCCAKCGSRLNTCPICRRKVIRFESVSKSAIEG